MVNTGTKLGPIDLSSDISPIEVSGGEEWY